MPKKRPEYRNDRAHSDFLTTLQPYFATPQQFQQFIIDEMGKHYSLDSKDTSLEELTAMSEELLKGKSFGDLVRTKIENIEDINGQS